MTWKLFDEVWDFLELHHPKGHKNMKFLSKLSLIFAKGLQLVGLFQPAIQQINPQAGQAVQIVSQDLTQVFGAVVDAERIGEALKLPGPQKLQAAIPLIGDIILKSSALANHKVKNQELFDQGLAKVADGSADIVNSLDDSGIQVIDKKA